jgi:GTP-binding protein
MNALLGYRRSIVYDKPGTTLDVISEKPKWANLVLIDTQGVFNEGDTDFLRKTLMDVDAVLFVVDAIVGCTPFDEWVSKEIKFLKKPTLLCINKAEAKKSYQEEEFAKLGIEEVITISAAHRTNIDFVKEWCAIGTTPTTAEGEEPLFRFTLIGRPNSGKSTLMNRLCGAEVSRVSPEPLTTRDPVSYELEMGKDRIQIIDTAGMRRPRSKKEGIETYSIQATTRAIRDSQVICLLINSSEAITDQDMRLLNLVVREGRPVMILLNMWDKLSAHERKTFFEYSDFTRYLENFKTMPISGKTGYNVERILPNVQRLYQQAQKRVPTSKLNRIVEGLIQRNPPPTSGQGNFNIMYASQVRVDPPSFVFFMNRKASLPKSYQLYLSNQLRLRLGLRSQACRVWFREAH